MFMKAASTTVSPAPAVYLYSINDACKALGGMGRTWLYAEIKRGAIRTVTLGSRRLVPASEIERLVNEAMGVAA